MDPFPFRLVTVDIDGTLTRVHGWRLIARAFGREKEYGASNRRFFAREVSEDLHLKNLLDLAVGRTRADVEAVLASTPLVDGIEETIEALHARGSRVALLTHNPDYVCDWYRQRFSFDDASGTGGTVFEGPTIVDSGPALARKRAGLVDLAQRAGVAAVQIAHIGDGWADAELFPYVGAGVAFNSSFPEVERGADAVVRSPSLAAVVAALERLRPRAVVDDGVPSAHSSNTPDLV